MPVPTVCARRSVRPLVARRLTSPITLLVLAALLGHPGAAAAQAATPRASSAPGNLLFVGTGPAKTGEEMPLVFGYVYLSPTSSWILGGDIAREGLQQDNTYGGSSLEPAFSFNAIVGRGLRLGSHWTIGVSGLLGARVTDTNCEADSVLGYQCYADEDPTLRYTVNAGGMAHIAYRHVMVGGRVTSVSTQVLVGIAF